MLLRPVVRVERDSFTGVPALPDIPTVISQGAQGWPAMSRCTMEQLKRQFGSIRIPVRETDNEFEDFFSNVMRHDPLSPRRMMTLSAYIDALTARHVDSTRPPYAGNISILHDPAIRQRMNALISECRFTDLFRSAHGDEYRVWIGGTGQRSTIHHDSSDNFNAQIVGRKRFIVFAPQHGELLHVRFYYLSMWASPIDPVAPDITRYPDFRDVEGYECTLNEGDILFLPAFWWHYVEALQPSVNINRWVSSTVTLTPRQWYMLPALRAGISYSKLLHDVREQYQSLPVGMKHDRKAFFDEIEASIIALIDDSE